MGQEIDGKTCDMPMRMLKIRISLGWSCARPLVRSLIT